MTISLPPLMRDVTRLVASADPSANSDSSLYQRISIEDLVGGGTRTTIIGCRLVLDASSPLYQALHRPADLTATAAQGEARDEVLILCDVLELNAPLIMPSRNVIIHARHLMVGPHGKLDLSAPKYAVPAANAHEKTPGADGLPGWSAGTLRMYIADFTLRGAVRPVFVAIGGDGQVPGKGAKGVKGNSVPFRDKAEFIVGFPNQWRTETVDLNCPAIGYEVRKVYETVEQGTYTAGSKYYTNNSVKWDERHTHPNDQLSPSNGTDAVAAGKPGEPGNAGMIYGNHTTSIRDICVQNGGHAGTLANLDANIGQDGYYPGGEPGSPDHHAFHMVEVKIFRSTQHVISKRTVNTFNEVRVQPGQRALGLAPPKRTIGDPGQLIPEGGEHSWLHPLQVRAVIDYVRDVYLLGDWAATRSVLAPYNQALQACCRDGTGGAGHYNPWLSTTTESLGGLAAEVAGLMSTLDRNCDYFGNAAGHMPLLSLQATAAKFDLDIDVALRTMLLADWVADVQGANVSTAAAMAWASENAAKERKRAEELVKQADEDIAETNKSLNLLKMRIDAETQKAAKLEDRLRREATATEETRARIDLLVKIAGAACTVIPYGQPILGAVGGVVTDLASWNRTGKEFPVDGLKDAVKVIGEEIKEYREKEKAAQEKKEADAKKAEEELSKALEANLEAGTSRARSMPLVRPTASIAADQLKEKADAANKAREDTQKRWQHVGANVGKATGLIQKGIAGLTVPQSTIEAGLAELKAASPEWAALAKSIEALNREKVEIVSKLTSAVEMFAKAVGVMSTATSSIAAFDRAQSSALSVINVDAVQALQKMKSAARLTIARTLYSLAKSYEAQVFKPAPIDWSVLQVYDHVKRTLAPEKKQGLTWATLSSADTITMLKTLFDKQKQTIWAALEANGDLARFQRYETPLTLSATQTPAELTDLNGPERRVTLNPFDLRLITPTKERQWLIDVDLVKDRLSFARPGKRGGEARIIEITLHGGRQGIVRRGLDHFGVSSADGRFWSWRYDTLTGELTKSSPETSIAEAFTTFFPHAANLDRGRRQQLQGMLSAAPLWTDLMVEVRSDGQDLGVLPRLVQLEFRLHIQAVTNTSRSEFVVIRSVCGDGSAGIMLSNDGGLTRSAMRGDFQTFLKRTGKPIIVDQVPGARTHLAAVRVLSSKLSAVASWQPLPVTLPENGDDYLIECETQEQQHRRLAHEGTCLEQGMLDGTAAISAAMTMPDVTAAISAGITMPDVTPDSSVPAPSPLLPLIYETPDDEASIIGMISDRVEPDIEPVPDRDDWFLVHSEGIIGLARRVASLPTA